MNEVEGVTRDGEVITLSHDLGLRGRVLRVGWELPTDLSEEDWRAAGELLGNVEQSVSWWIGDWWAFGERYGDRVAIVKSEHWNGPSYQGCRDAAFVAGQFDVSRRRDSLSFTHHREVAALPAEDADELLNWAESSRDGKPRSTRELRSEVSRRRSPVGLLPSSETCTTADLATLAASGQRFGCIYADPPWLYDNQGTRAATGNHYSGLTVAELCDLPIGELTADDAHLHMWVTNGFLEQSFAILRAWGFEFRSTFVWIKPQMGIGNYWRNSHEILLTAIRGNAKRFNDHSMMSYLECDRGRHSAKPEQVRAMLERASPGPYLELFGRRVAENWTVWGNQIERSLFMPGEAA